MFYLIDKLNPNVNREVKNAYSQEVVDICTVI